MALESVNSWTVKNYAATAWSSIPSRVMVENNDFVLEGYYIRFDLYKSGSYRTTVSYVESPEDFENEDQSEHDRRIVEQSNFAKTRWLMEQASE